PPAATTVNQKAAAARDAIGELLTSSKRVVALQRALSEYGFGQIRPSGTLDAQTKTAIEEFERHRNLPVTGQPSERVTRELSAMTGRIFEDVCALNPVSGPLGTCTAAISKAPLPPAAAAVRKRRAQSASRWRVLMEPLSCLGRHRRPRSMKRARPI